MSKVFTGKNASISVNGVKVGFAQNVTYKVGGKGTSIPAEYEDFLRFLISTGNIGAKDLVKDCFWVSSLETHAMNYGSARQPGENDAELRKRLKK